MVITLSISDGPRPSLRGSRIAKGILTHEYSNQQMALVSRKWRGRNQMLGSKEGEARHHGFVLEGKRGFVSSLSIIRCVLSLTIVLSLSYPL